MKSLRRRDERPPACCEAEALYAPRPADRLSAPGQSRHFAGLPMTSGLHSEADIVAAGPHVSKVPISEIPDATLRRRQKQRNYSGVQSDRTRNVTYGCERTGCEAKALQRSLPDETLSILARGLLSRIRRADRSAERARCPPLLRQRRQCVFELRRPLATGPMQKRIHGLS